MNLTIPIWRGRWTGQYYWQYPGQPIHNASDIGTATREALELAEMLVPGQRAINFYFTTV